VAVRCGSKSWTPRHMDLHEWSIPNKHQRRHLSAFMERIK
jgi:hypothetical protein